MVALSLAVTVLAVGCSSGAGDVRAAGSTSTTEAAGGDTFAAFAACMRERGVDLPAEARGGQAANHGAGDAGGPADDGATGQEDATAGGEEGDDGGGPAHAGGNDAPLPPGVDRATYDAARQACESKLPARNRGDANGSAYRAYLSCLRDNGLSVPTTEPGRRPSIDRSDPKFAAADETCSVLLAPDSGAVRTTTTAAGAPAP